MFLFRQFYLIAIFALMSTIVSLASDGGAQTKSKGTVLHSFVGGSDSGNQPYSNLVIDQSGNIFGTTAHGGVNDAGTVFEVAPDGTETVLHSFGSGDDGQNPVAGLVMDKSGDLYGTTQNGGGGFISGVGFKLTPGGGYTILHRFTGGNGNDPDGGRPAATLIMDKKGNLYGTTHVGGGRGDCNANNCGTVFKIAPDGTETVLYSFSGRKDGGYPSAPLVIDQAGNLYGTTETGGRFAKCGFGCGVVFKVSPDGNETVLHAFRGIVSGDPPGDGQDPLAGLVIDSSGSLYGTTATGGVGAGVAFKLMPNGKETILFRFSAGNPGVGPSGSLVMDAQGDLYGTTQNGGTSNNGVVFKLTPKGKETVLYSLAGGISDGWWPFAGIIMDAKGDIYGTTVRGGASDSGTVFKLTN
jgi:uncharacterized repeat protein (TIGR03803 family)